MSCVSTTSFSMSQMVHVVSRLDVPMRCMLVSFQSKLVSGAQISLFLLLFSSDLSCTPSSLMFQTRR